MADGDTLEAQFDTLAREHGRRVVAVVAAGTAYTVFAPGPPGWVAIDAGAGDLYLQLERDGGFGDPAVAAAWRSYALAASRTGVEHRQANELLLAYLHLRFALYVTVKVGEPDGVPAVVGNVWAARDAVRDLLERAGGPRRNPDWSDEMREALRRFREEADWTRQAVRADAAFLLPGLVDLVERFDGEPDRRLRLWLALHRLAGLAANAEVREAALTELLREADALGDADAPLLAATEELSLLDGEEVLVAAGRFPPEAAPAAARGWATYEERRRALPRVRDVQAVTARCAAAFRQLGFLRVGATSAGGAFGHELSYDISTLLQAVGRDVTAGYFRLGRHEEALATAEQTLARAMTDWMARTHAAWRPASELLAEFEPVMGSLNAVDEANIEDIRAVAAAIEAPLVYFLTHPDGLRAWVVRPQGEIVAAELGDLAPALDPVLAELPFLPSREGSRPRDARPQPTSKSSAGLMDALRALHDALLPPELREALAGTGERLVVVADPALNAVPFPALRSSDGYLLEERELVFWPSVTAWLVLEAGTGVPHWRRARREGPVAPVVVGKTAFEAEYELEVEGEVERLRFGELPGAGEEAAVVAKLLGTGPLPEADASPDALIAASGAEVMHLATHGFLHEDHPRASCLVLSDGVLFADALYRFDPGVRAGLVVMSACQTALGGRHPDSVIGLANAFLIAGAQTVVSTLWRIADDTTPALMRSFYRGVTSGEDVPRALRRAQLETLARSETSHPAYWAAFRVTGRMANPRTSGEASASGCEATHEATTS